MAELARSMLAGQCDLIEGCRRVASLATLIGDEDDPAIIPFRGFASETDHFPRGGVREHYAGDYLERLDKEEAEYLAEEKTEILRSCHDLLSKYDG